MDNGKKISSESQSNRCYGEIIPCFPYPQYKHLIKNAQGRQNIMAIGTEIFNPQGCIWTVAT